MKFFVCCEGAIAIDNIAYVEVESSTGDPELEITVYMKVPTEHSMTLTNKDALTLLAQLREEQ